MRCLSLVLCLLAAGCASAERAAPPPRVAVAETAGAAWARGRFLESSGRYAEAEAAYRLAYELGERRALWSLAYLFRSARRFGEAERTFKRCQVELPDEQVRLWRTGRVVPVQRALRLQLAELYLETNRLDEAAALLDAVLEEDPDCWIALEMRGNVDLFRRKIDKARERYTAALARITDLGKEGAEAANLEWLLLWAHRVDDFA